MATVCVKFPKIKEVRAYAKEESSDQGRPTITIPQYLFTAILAKLLYNRL